VAAIRWEAVARATLDPLAQAQIREDHTWALPGMSFSSSFLSILGIHRRESGDVRRLKRELLVCLRQAGIADEYLLARIDMCRSRGDLVLARADVMQHLAKLVGEQEADRQLHQLWGNDDQIRQMQRVEQRKGITRRSSPPPVHF
jgi:hypothetical protein